MTGTVSWFTRDRLRILAYHDVPDPGPFRAQVEYLVRRYRPVTARDVVAAVADGRRLPERAVWVTFDDGYADVVTNGLPVLQDHGIVATLFICPGAIESGEPLWFMRVLAALEAGVRPARIDPEAPIPTVMAQLKSLPDDERRTIVDGFPPGGEDRIASRALIDRWVDAGQHVGNHTWDHPCLPRCDEADQRRQVADARSWIDRQFPGQPRVFAYPNGDAEEVTAAIAAAAGETVRLRFDHRLATMSPGGDLSRLRVSSQAGQARFRAIASGGHSLAFTLSRTLTRHAEARAA